MPFLQDYGPFAYELTPGVTVILFICRGCAVTARKEKKIMTMHASCKI